MFVTLRQPDCVAPACAGASAAARFALLALGVSLFCPVLLALSAWWRLDPNYAHGWLVPLFGSFLFFTALKSTTRDSPMRLWGMVTLGAGGMLHLAAQIVPWPLLQFAAMFFLLRGVLLTLGGAAWARAGLVPSLFFIFMFPLPVIWTAAAAMWLQQQVSSLSAVAINIACPCVRQGTALRVAGVEQPLIVAEACSGLRQLVAFAALAVMLGQLLRRPAWQIVLLVIFAAPCAIVANTLRILVMAAGARFYGVGWLHGWAHDVPAMFTIPIGVGLFLAVTRLLPSGARSQQGPVKPSSPVEVPRSLLAGLAGLLLMQFALQWHLTNAPLTAPATLTKPLAAFPVTLAPTGSQSWSGHDLPASPASAEQLSFADQFIQRRYVEAASRSCVELFVVFSSQGRDREHHPEICVRDVGGAQEDAAARQLIKLGEKATAQRFCFRQGYQPPLTIYYWHYTLTGDEAPYGPRDILYRLHERLTRRRASVTVEVSTYLPRGALPAVEADLLPTLHNQLLTHLPSGTKTGCDRLPIRLAGGD